MPKKVEKTPKTVEENLAETKDIFKKGYPPKKRKVYKRKEKLISGMPEIPADWATGGIVNKELVELLVDVVRRVQDKSPKDVPNGSRAFLDFYIPLLRSLADVLRDEAKRIEEAPIEDPNCKQKPFWES